VSKIKQVKSLTEDQKEQLQSKKEDEIDAKNSIDYQKKLVEQNQKEKNGLLKISQSKESEYQKVLDERQKKVKEIKNKLFSFAGGSTKSIPFATAYKYAKEASASTGVETAFILAILTQESNLGRNVGTCNRAGDPPSKSYTAMMNPTRDIPPFLRITSALGLNPETTPISCRIGTFGWGGGMGPAQFIPSTWEGYDNKVAAILGKSIANPWIAEDAIIASALLHKANGGVGGESSQRNAACKYYSGRSCSASSQGAGYGNSVMRLTRSIQVDIDYLEAYGISRR
jgi:membrane-bound lytic murein transglycosylase B